MTLKHLLPANDALTQLVKEKGIYSWEKLIQYTRKIPYGRNTSRTDFSLVIKENKGTCSSKHAFLKSIADLNHIPDIKLILGMYKMNQANTPKIGNALSSHNVDYIPEAHCYLKIDNRTVDITTEASQFDTIKNDILQEKEITPEQVVEYKVKYHKSFIKKWIKGQNITYDFDTIWSIREKCIKNLSDS